MSGKDDVRFVRPLGFLYRLARPPLIVTSVCPRLSVPLASWMLLTWRVRHIPPIMIAAATPVQSPPVAPSAAAARGKKPAASFWTITPAEAAANLGCTIAGLTTAEAADRLARHGRNVDTQARAPGLVASVTQRLLEPMCLILIAAAIVSATTGDTPSALIILLILGA